MVLWYPAKRSAVFTLIDSLCHAEGEGKQVSVLRTC